MACSLLMAWNRLPCANPLSIAVGETRSRCGARLPAYLYHWPFPCSIPLPSPSVAHSSSINPAPLVRLLLDTPEVKHLQPRVASTTKLQYLPFKPFATAPYHHRPPKHSFPACLQLDCIRILPPLAHVSFQTRTTIVHPTQQAIYRITIIELRWKLRSR